VVQASLHGFCVLSLSLSLCFRNRASSLCLSPAGRRSLDARRSVEEDGVFKAKNEEDSRRTRGGLEEDEGEDEGEEEEEEESLFIANAARIKRRRRRKVHYS